MFRLYHKKQKAYIVLATYALFTVYVFHIKELILHPSRPGPCTPPLKSKTVEKVIDASKIFDGVLEVRLENFVKQM